MAIDPKKMAAFANKVKPQGGGPAPTDSDYKDGSDGDDHNAESHEEDTDHDDEDSDGQDDDMKEFGDGKFGSLIPLLEEHAEDIEAAAEEIDADALASDDDLPDDEQGILDGAIKSLDKQLASELKSAFAGGISREEANELAEHLADEDQITLTDQVAGWLFHVAKSL